MRFVIYSYQTIQTIHKSRRNRVVQDQPSLIRLTRPDVEGLGTQPVPGYQFAPTIDRPVHR